MKRYELQWRDDDTWVTSQYDHTCKTKEDKIRKVKVEPEKYRLVRITEEVIYPKPKRKERVYE